MVHLIHAYLLKIILRIYKNEYKNIVLYHIYYQLYMVYMTHIIPIPPTPPKKEIAIIIVAVSCFYIIKALKI